LIAIDIALAVLDIVATTAFICDETLVLEAEEIADATADIIAFI
jgi:hypothetical protein